MNYTNAPGGGSQGAATCFPNELHLRGHSSVCSLTLRQMSAFFLPASLSQLLHCRIPTLPSLYVLDFHNEVQTCKSLTLILLPEVNTVAPSGSLTDISIRWKMCLGPEKQRSGCPSCKAKRLKWKTPAQKEKGVQATLQVLRRMVSQAPLYCNSITCPHLFSFQELEFNY